MHPGVDEQDVDRAVTHDLIGDVHVVDLRERVSGGSDMDVSVAPVSTDPRTVVEV